MFILEENTKRYKTQWAQKKKEGNDGTPKTPSTHGRKAKGKDGGGGGGGGDRDGGGDEVYDDASEEERESGEETKKRKRERRDRDRMKSFRTKGKKKSSGGKN